MATKFVVVPVVVFVLSFCLTMETGVMTGGISHLDLKDPENREVIMKGIGIFLEELKMQDSSHVLYKPICVQASSQVVQGVEYRVAMEIAPEKSVPGPVTDFDCIPEADSASQANKQERFVCFTIWERKWMKKPPDFIVKEKKASDVQSCLTV